MPRYRDLRDIGNISEKACSFCGILQRPPRTPAWRFRPAFHPVSDSEQLSGQAMETDFWHPCHLESRAESRLEELGDAASLAFSLASCLASRERSRELSGAATSRAMHVSYGYRLLSDYGCTHKRRKLQRSSRVIRYCISQGLRSWLRSPLGRRRAFHIRLRE